MAIRKYWLLISLGIVVLVNFVGIIIVRRSTKSILENRQLAVRLQLPKSILRLPMWFKESLTPFIQDTFVFREASIKSNRAIKLAIGDEPNNDVWTGKHGWLFLASPLVSTRLGPYGDPYSDTFGDKSETNASVEFARIARLVDICKKSGTKLIVLYPPNKETIYPEFLATQPHANQSALDLLEANLTSLPVSVIHVKRELLAAKSHIGMTNLYYPQDTHWNYFGASVIANKLLTQVSELIDSNVERPKYVIQQSGYRVSDLAVMNRSLTAEPEFLVKFANGHEHFIADHYGPLSKCIVIRRKPHKILVYRDSFFSALEPFFMHSKIDVVTMKSESWKIAEMEQQIAVEKPDVVVFERIERYIGD